MLNGTNVDNAMYYILNHFLLKLHELIPIAESVGGSFVQ